MKNTNYTIGNRTHDLPVCSTVPQALRHHVPRYTVMYSQQNTQQIHSLYKHKFLTDVDIDVEWGHGHGATTPSHLGL
jgi:arginine/lysine/ornithine decarboxylase